jgi:hypothetical protein
MGGQDGRGVWISPWISLDNKEETNYRGAKETKAWRNIKKRQDI